MNKKELEYLQYLALADLTTYHYKILLLLNEKVRNQAQLAEILDIQKQNAYKYIKWLERMNLVKVDRIEGRNKFYKAVTDLERIQQALPGQTKIEEGKHDG